MLADRAILALSLIVAASLTQAIMTGDLLSLIFDLGVWLLGAVIWLEYHNS
jgi:hypothetical protein